MRQTWREMMSVVADFLQITGWLGLTASVVYGILVWLVGWLTPVPWYWILVGAPFSALAFLAAWNWLVVLRRPIASSPPLSFKHSEWVNHPTYYVWVAAHLWVNCAPWPYIPADSPAYPALQKIKSAIEGGQIKVMSGSGNAMSRLTREELLKLAQIHNEHPLFLFPK